MAKVEEFVERQPVRVSVHGDVEASFHSFEHEGEKFLQIDTYGATGRQIPSKVSQSLQLGLAGRKALLEILLKMED